MSVYDPTPQMEAIMAVPTMNEIKDALRLVSDNPSYRNKISRDVAKERGLKRFFTGSECVNGHVADRLVSNGNCVDCYYANKRSY